MQHYALFLESYNYEIRYKNSKQNANADALSRLPVPEISDKMEEIDIIELNMIENLPISPDELAQATLADKSVKKLLQGLRYGHTVPANDRFNIDQSEFCLQQNCLLRGIRIYIPETLRVRVLDELHSSHFGIVRMKSLARGNCWWPNIDNDIEKLVKNCEKCCQQQSNPPKMNTAIWETPEEPFERVHCDYAGPFQGHYFFVLVDAKSKWPEVRMVKNATAETTVKVCREIFSTFGLPRIFVTDHGTQFTSKIFSHFLKMNGIRHRMGAPYHPATNGQAERYVRTIKEKLKALKYSNDIHTSLCNILLMYRKTTHPSTKTSPSMSVFNRQIRSRLDVMRPMKSFSVRKPEHKVRKLHIGDRVICREYLSNNVKWRFGTVTEKLGALHYIIQLDDGRMWKRHIDQIKVTGNNVIDDEKIEVPVNAEDDVEERHDLVPDFGIEVKNNGQSNVTPNRTEEMDQQPVVEDKQITTVPTDLNQEVRASDVPRRSQRTIKAPQRMNL